MESNGLSYAVVGAGFNVFPPPHGFPEQLKSIAGAIYPSKPDKAVKSLLAARFVRYMTEFYLSLPEHSFMEEYKRKSCVVGKILHSCARAKHCAEQQSKSTTTAD